MTSKVPCTLKKKKTEIAVMVSLWFVRKNIIICWTTHFSQQKRNRASSSKHNGLQFLVTAQIGHRDKIWLMVIRLDGLWRRGESAWPRGCNTDSHRLLLRTENGDPRLNPARPGRRAGLWPLVLGRETARLYGRSDGTKFLSDPFASGRCVHVKDSLADANC